MLHKKINRLLPAMNQASQAVVGQGLFAGAHFVANILLARWLPPAQYGIFALAYSFFLLFSMLYCACIYEPVLVYGAGRHAGQFRHYVNLVLAINALLFVPVVLGMLLISPLLRHFYSPAVAIAFLALAVAAPAVLTTWFARATFYAQIKPGKAALCGGIYFCVLVVWLVLFRHWGSASPAAAFLGMGAAGLLSNVFFLSQLPAKHSVGRTLRFNVVAADHWRYGRWAIASAFAAWFPDNIYYALLPARTGLEGTAALRALMNLINPALHTLVALSGFLIPVLVKHARQGGLSKMTSTMKAAVMLVLPGTLIYFSVLFVCRPFLFHTIYAGRYAQYSGWPLLLVGIIPVTTGVAVIFSTALRALEKPETVFWCYLAAGLVCVVVGLPLTVYEGVLGAAGGLVITSSVALVCMAWAFHRCVTRAKASEQATCIPEPVLSD